MDPEQNRKAPLAFGGALAVLFFFYLFVGLDIQIHFETKKEIATVFTHGPFVAKRGESIRVMDGYWNQHSWMLYEGQQGDNIIFKKYVYPEYGGKNPDVLEASFDSGVANLTWNKCMKLEVLEVTPEYFRFKVVAIKKPCWDGWWRSDSIIAAM